MPTTPLILAGSTIDPIVSVPTAIKARSAAMATAEPPEEPPGLRLSEYGLYVIPPRALQPLLLAGSRKSAHSHILVFPRITAPASRKRVTRNASCGGVELMRDNEPAVVCMLSAVSMLSFN